MATTKDKKKPWNDENENFGEWDTSVTDPPKGTVTPPPPQAAIDAKRNPSAYDDTDFDMLGRLPTSEEPSPDAPAPPPAAAVQVTPAPAGERAYKTVPTAAEMSATGTTIGPTIVVRGKMRCDEHLVVKGRMEAHIKSAKDLRVEGTGVVNANIDVHAVSVSGIVVGDIRASELVELAPEARVIGDITTPRLIIHEGARFRGKIEMDGLQALEMIRPQAPVEVELDLEELDEEPAPAPRPIESPRPTASAAPPPVRPVGKGVVAAPAEPLSLKPNVSPREAAAPPPIAPVAPRAAAGPAPAKPAPAPAPAPTPAPAPSTDKGASAGWFGRRNNG